MTTKTSKAAADVNVEDVRELTRAQLAEIAGVDETLLLDDPMKTRRVWVTVPKGPKGDVPYVSPSVNGKTIQIERGKKVSIPEAYWLAMLNQVEQRYDEKGEPEEEANVLNAQLHGYDKGE
ncbi:MAG: hypothetical protein JNM11_00965 [Chitinimonas sp.]|nr:hypothetical protein [Chitinimonas sp.]